MADGERICALEARVSQLEAAFARALGAAGAVRAAGPAEPAAQDAPPPAAVLLSAPPGPPSRVAAEFPPAALAEFRGRAFALLWRGSRDGFLAGAFHRRCDGRAPTLTLIRDAGGCIFGGFTPVRWESRWGARRSPCFKADPSLASFIFSLRGPRGAQPKRFPLRARRMGEAIGCNYRWGPDFSDLRVGQYCDAGRNSRVSLGETYRNDTGVDGATFLIGSDRFTVTEIEVFEITD